MKTIRRILCFWLGHHRCRMFFYGNEASPRLVCRRCGAELEKS